MNTMSTAVTRFADARERDALVARAVAKALELKPPCARCARATATRVVGMSGAGNPRVLCATCADGEHLDRRIERQRAERAAMARRR
jgi:hypothetical protein